MIIGEFNDDPKYEIKAIEYVEVNNPFRMYKVIRPCIFPKKKLSFMKRNAGAIPHT